MLRTQQGDVDELAGGLLYAADHDKGRERDILEALARGDMKLMRFVPALAVLNRCLKRHPDDVRALNWRGWLLDRMDRHEEAVADYKHALESCPAHAGGRLRLASSYLDHNDPASAEPHLRPMQAHPGRTEVQLELARCRFLLGEESELRLFAGQGARRPPGRTDGPPLSRQIGRAGGPREEAEGYFRRRPGSGPELRGGAEGPVRQPARPARPGGGGRRRAEEVRPHDGRRRPHAPVDGGSREGPRQPRAGLRTGQDQSGIGTGRRGRLLAKRRAGPRPEPRADARRAGRLLRQEGRQGRGAFRSAAWRGRTAPPRRRER